MTAAPLVLAAHGSADPRFAEVIESLAALVAGLRPALELRIGYLDHGPDLRGVAAGGVTVPVFLARGYHVNTDVPARADLVTQAVGPDPRLATVLADRLREAGWNGGPAVLAAADSSDPRALADVRQTAADLGAVLDTDVSAAVVSELSDSDAVASYLLAPGAFADRIATCGAPIVSAPLGADPLIAEIILDRYDAFLASHQSGAQRDA
jgi:sirohydrochlorin ferrochelatase